MIKKQKYVYILHRKTNNNCTRIKMSSTNISTSTKQQKRDGTPHLITSVLLRCHELLHPLPSGLHEDDGANLAQNLVLGT